MSEWKRNTLEKFAIIAPTENLAVGKKSKKVPMEFLKPFMKKIPGFLIEDYKGGARFRNGDVLVARITPCLENGKTAYVDILDHDEVAFGSTEFIVLRERANISDKNFLYYFSISSEFRDIAILSMTGSSGRQRVQIDAVKNHFFLIPPLSEQKAIASILSSLDDKIDLLYRQNKTLEAMAETLFRQWFLEEAEEDWEQGKILNEFDFIMGVSPPGESYNEEGNGIPMFQGNADFEFRFPKNRVYTMSPIRFAEKYDTLISVRAPVGAQNMASEKCCIGRGLAAFRYKRNNAYYTYTYFKMKSLMEEIKQFNETGTVFGSISKGDFEEFEIVIPPDKLVDKFQSEIKPFDDKVITNSYQIRNLEKLRDTLLPKLISGEVRVKWEEGENGDE